MGIIGLTWMDFGSAKDRERKYEMHLTWCFFEIVHIWCIYARTNHVVIAKLTQNNSAVEIRIENVIVEKMKFESEYMEIKGRLLTCLA